MQKKRILALVMGVTAIAGYAQENPVEETTLTPAAVESTATESVLPTPEVINQPVQESQIIPETSTQISPPSEQPVVEKQMPEVQRAPQEIAAPVEQTPEEKPVATEVQEVAAPIEEVQTAQETATPVAPPQPGPEPEEHAEELEIKGINTVDVDSEPKGNWLYKRIWWEKAERTYEKIKQLTDKILEARILYFARRTDLDRNVLDPFYLGQGFNQGELTEIINYLTQQLEQERKEGSIDEKERDLLTILTEEKKNLEGLQKGVSMVSNIDHAIDDALLKLSEQLNQAKMYEQQAWQSFKAINRELSDKKARELYYSMDTYWRNLNNINSYISGSFAQYFDQLDDRIKQEVENIKSTMGTLKEKGIDIQSQAQKLKAGKSAEKEEETVEAEQAPTGFVETLISWIKAPFTGIANLFGSGFNWITGLFGGGTEEISLARPERSAE